MGMFDSFTSIFSSDTTPAPDAPVDTPNPDQPIVAPVPAGPTFDPNMMLSPSYSLANLCATNQQLSQPNYPTSQAQIDNLTVLADVLEQLGSQIGAFTLLSGFRTKELQMALAAKGEPTASGTSFHELGRAEDISPTTMSITEMFGRILANESLKNKFAEIAIKPSQNAIHLSVNTPADTRTPKVLGLNNEGIYTRLSLDDIVRYITPYMTSTAAATSYADAELAPPSVSPMLIGLAALGIGAYFLSKKK